MKCPHCGFENEEGEEICSSCGNEIVLSEELRFPDEESEDNPTYGAIYDIESKKETEEEPKEELDPKDESFSKDWRKELKKRVKEIKKKKEKEKSSKTISDTPAGAVEKPGSAESEKAQPEVPPEYTEQDNKKENLPFEEEGKSNFGEKESSSEKEPTLFSLDDDEPFPSETEEAPAQKPPMPKGEFPEEKTYPDELQKIVEDYQPLDEEVYEKPVRDDDAEKAELTPEMDVTDREVIVKSRVFAGIFDLIIVAILYLAIVYFAMRILGIDYMTLLQSAPVPLAGLLLLLSMTYFVYFTGFSGQTIGMMALKIRVVSMDDGRVSFPRAFLRWVGYLISASVLLLGFLWIAFDSEARGWHDKISGTRVEIHY